MKLTRIDIKSPPFLVYSNSNKIGAYLEGEYSFLFIFLTLLALVTYPV